MIITTTKACIVMDGINSESSENGLIVIIVRFYLGLTESQIIGWVKDRLNKDSANTDSNIEAALAVNINEAKAPTIASGVPW